MKDSDANIWPDEEFKDQQLLDHAPGIAGALNLFFLRDIEGTTAYSYLGGGPIFIGDEGNTILGPRDFQQLVAHEIGHALCLQHVCSAEETTTFFNRECEDGDEAYLMYPFWDTSDGMTILPGQISPARTAATHFEVGKKVLLPIKVPINQNEIDKICLSTDINY